MNNDNAVPHDDRTVHTTMIYIYIYSQILVHKTVWSILKQMGKTRSWLSWPYPNQINPLYHAKLQLFLHLFSKVCITIDCINNFYSRPIFFLSRDIFSTEEKEAFYDWLKIEKKSIFIAENYAILKAIKVAKLLQVTNKLITSDSLSVLIAFKLVVNNGRLNQIKSILNI